VTFTAAQGVEPTIMALDAGASGYVLKGGTSDELVQAIASVQSGDTYITQSSTSEVIARLRGASLRAGLKKKLSDFSQL
jgi:DNA-binding NarL/FixJ family response regulator